MRNNESHWNDLKCEDGVVNFEEVLIAPNMSISRLTFLGFVGMKESVKL